MSIPASFRDRLSLPVIGSPMFIASTPELVIEQCKAGVIGSFPALNARPASALDEWLTRIRRELDDYAAANPQAKVAPIAVNQIAHASNDRLQHDVERELAHALRQRHEQRDLGQRIGDHQQAHQPAKQELQIQGLEHRSSIWK